MVVLKHLYHGCIRRISLHSTSGNHIVVSRKGHDTSDIGIHGIGIVGVFHPNAQAVLVGLADFFLGIQVVEANQSQGNDFFGVLLVGFGFGLFFIVGRGTTVTPRIIFVRR